MTRLLRALTPAACALALLVVPPAHAATSSSFGECGFDTYSQESVTGPDVFTGGVYAAVVLYGSGHHNVVNATVTCELQVNGVAQASSSRWGSGLVVLADTLTFVAGDTDTVRLCTIVDFTSDDTPTTRVCEHTTNLQMPPQEWIDLIDVVFDWVNGALVTYVDPNVCAAFQALAPGVPPVTISPYGDLSINGEQWWDCPPYDVPMPQPWPPGPPPLPGGGPYGATGGGYNTGDAGFLLLTDPGVASTCAFVTDRATGTIAVLGTTATADADSATIHCVLTDTATGTPLYDETVSADARKAVLHDVIPAHDAPVTVCTEGSGVWADRTATVGLHCRPGEPVGGAS